MGLLVDGEWKTDWYDTKSTGGKFVRPDTKFRDRVIEPAAGRYHLYVGYACPWACRALMARVLKGLEDVISVSAVDAHMGDEGWTFSPGADPVNGATHLHQVYRKAKPDYTGRVTVPVLWDIQRGTIVNNESADLLRILNQDFQPLAGRPDVDLYPDPLRPEIDAINERVYHTVNNGVYKAGFATEQGPYEDAFDALFETLDWLEGLLTERRYLAGARFTEADARLFTTLVRFDAVYHGHFKCNLRRIVDYPNLWGFVREVYQMPGIAGTVNMDHIKRHYYGSHDTINPTRIVPKGPALDLDAPHGRDHLPAQA